jgi:cysteinyl-tRNA synthetase
MFLYDTLERRVKSVKPAVEDKLGFYCCGPTVYGPAHIGNFRTFLVQDVLRRTLELGGFSVVHVRNITDVDDKTIRQAQVQNMTLGDFTQMWIERFHNDCAALNCLVPNYEPVATDYIKDMIGLIERLVEKGVAYRGGDGSIYYRVSSFKEYGKLSRLKERSVQTQDLNSGGAVNVADQYDRDSVADFVLWKTRRAEDGENFWPSPWGDGRPGWHIECSAMSMRFLGESFDLHGGGVDLCFPHHENEIAQSEAASGRCFVRHWFHSAHLLVEGEKMSKSLGNLYSVQELTKRGFSPMDIRYALISGHYRQPFNFTFNGLRAAQSALRKLEKRVETLLEMEDLETARFQDFQRPLVIGKWLFLDQAWKALQNDLNTSACLGALFSVLQKSELKEKDRLALLKELGALTYALGLKLFSEKSKSDDIPKKIQDIADRRWVAKQGKDWAKADALREELIARGWQVFDSKDAFVLAPIELKLKE